MIFCWDSKISHRRIIYPSYKQKRHTKERTEQEKENDRSAFEQFTIIKNSILPSLEFVNSFCVDGYEADDIIAHIVFTLKNEYPIVVANDNDLWQLLSYCSMFHKNSLTTDKIFTRKYDIPPESWVKVKALAGCTSDDVKGIDGIGIKRAIQYLHGMYTPKATAYQKITSPKGQKIYRRNLKLVSLPFDNNLNLELFESHKIKKDKFIDLCNHYHFKSLLNGRVFSLWTKWFLK
jgi:5'-3' exonuclease